MWDVLGGSNPEMEGIGKHRTARITRFAYAVITSAARTLRESPGSKGEREPCSLVVVVTDGAAGTAAQWSRDTTFFGFSNVHDCALLSRLLCG